MKKLLFIILFIPLVSFGQNLPSDWTEKSVRNFFNKKGVKGIEGIYSFNHSLNNFRRGIWASVQVKKSDKFAIIYSKNDFAYIGYEIKSSNSNTKQNKTTKFLFQETATNGLFDAKWYDLFSEALKYSVKAGEWTAARDVIAVHPADLKKFLQEYPKAVNLNYKAGFETSLWTSKLNGALLTTLNDDKVSLIKMFPTRPKIDKVPKKTKKKDWMGNGSGLIISKQGHIVTNHHVIKDIDSIEVEFKNDKGINKYKAKVINSDEANDLAIIQIIDKKFEGFEETPNYNFDTEIAEVGTKVYAYGYPMALSVMGKEIKITDGIINSKMGFKDDIKTYQISAPIQGGNSGGPLFDEDGTLVGINSSGLSKEIADNVGYSIKSNYISNLISALPQKIELPYSYTIKWISTEKQIKRLSKYVVLIKVK